jgi:hypothetical protein
MTKKQGGSVAQRRALLEVRHEWGSVDALERVARRDLGPARCRRRRPGRRCLRRQATVRTGDTPGSGARARRVRAYPINAPRTQQKRGSEGHMPTQKNRVTKPKTTNPTRTTGESGGALWHCQVQWAGRRSPPGCSQIPTFAADPTHPPRAGTPCERSRGRRRKVTPGY